MTTTIAPARRAALQVLHAILLAKGNSDTLLHGPLLQPLSALDRNLCTALVLGTLRWQSILDAAIRKHLSHPDVTLPEPVQLALRIGAFQLLYMDRIPAHAAIYESVEWVKHSPNPRASGLVNAVLRKLVVMPKPVAIPNREAYPTWMVDRWRQNYGEQSAMAICAAGLEEPVASLRIFDTDAEAVLQTAGLQLAPGALVAKARRVLTGDIRNAAAWDQGQIQFQDEGSQLVAELLGNGNCILDCCAAPGGKTAILLENNPQATLLACDVSAARLHRMRQRTTSQKWNDRMKWRVVDAATPQNLGTFDRILCDVPCSGTGTLGRNPEIRHRLQPQDLTRHATRQQSVLSASLRRLAPGGRLLYATCSLEPEENEHVVERCLQELFIQKDYKLLDLQKEYQNRMDQGVIAGDSVSHLRDTGFRSGYLRTLPGLHPCDGFFAALIERVE